MVLSLTYTLAARDFSVKYAQSIGIQFAIIIDFISNLVNSIHFKNGSKNKNADC